MERLELDAPSAEVPSGKPLAPLLRRHFGAVATKLGYLQVMSIYAVERLTYLIVSFFVYPIVARAYGAEELGRYSLAQTIVTLVTPFLAAAGEAIIIRDLVRRQDARGQVAGSAALMLSLFTIPVVSAPIVYAGIVYSGD